MNRGGSLTKNSIYNLLGSGLPMVVGILTIPRLIHMLGVDRFGVLSLTWVVMGYFSLFDLGLGRALTQVVAERSVTDERYELADIIRTALIMMLLLGLVGGLFLGLVSPVVVTHVLKMTPALQTEAVYAFILMAFSVPAVTLLAGLRGILEARQQFYGISILRLCMGILTFLGPWLVTFWTVHLFWVVLSLEGMRYAALAAHHWLCRRTVPELRAGGVFRTRHWKRLITFGGWMTVSNIISPIMVNLDRFFIGGFVSVGAITYYATPFDMITKVFIISNAVVTVLFPMFGSLYLVDIQEAVRLYWKGLRTIFFALFPLLTVIAMNATFILGRWLGPDFAVHGAPVLQVLCLGVIINALAAVPYAYIQGAARPDLTAKFHLAEVPFYLGILWVLGTHFGILGVAWAWTFRVLLDLILLLIAAFRIQVSGSRTLRSAEHCDSGKNAINS